ncbi:hypothetical protein [Primorskyibacter sedentarius]|uniref:hypothetical protein n=1 Tax=Primorskyibacter sedentarius TaxID=745311 RepID=UPI003EBC0D35
MNIIEQTKSLAESHALEFKDCGNGHVQISGFGKLVNYWPTSRNMTAHVVGQQPVKHCRPWDAVKLCLGGTALKPDKKPSKNGPDFIPKAVRTNPAGVKHLYSGDIPPWEFPTFISAHSDDLRIQAYNLRCEADQMDELNQ